MAEVENNAEEPLRRWRWMDLVVFVFLAGLFYGIIAVAQEWKVDSHHVAEIHLSLWALPQYTLFTLSRGLIAFLFSLTFGIFYAYWAYYDKAAAKFLLPLLDILQSIPVLGFLPGLVLALVGLFPHSNVGLELACVLMIFTAQAWNLAFSFYDSLRNIPPDLRSLTEVYGFNRWQRFFFLELPAGAKGLVYNSMLSVAAGWFFITVNESFVLGEDSFRLPGLGSYMALAMSEGNVVAQIAGIVAMILMIVALDQLVWRPLVVWSQKFKFEDTQMGEPEYSRLLEWMGQSHVVQAVLDRLWHRRHFHPKLPKANVAKLPPWVGVWSYRLFLTAGLVGAVYLSAQLALLMSKVSVAEWARIMRDALLTFARVSAAVVLSTLWTVPVGIWIGLNPKWNRILQPVIQVAASFPAPMIYPVVVGVVLWMHGSLEWGSVLLMMLGTQWYILFNVAAGASAIPQDLLACAKLMRMSRWQTWRSLLVPAVLPALVTGWITASGGAWNASIVSEYVMYKNQPLVATGLGSLIFQATDKENFPALAGAVCVMAVVVVALNRSLWKKLYAIADDRFKTG
jgi:NitT/TauT family transport system permease protein